MAELKTIHMVSYYEGKPTFGIAKSGGTLTINETDIRYKKELGSSVSSSLGMIGILVGRNKVRKNGDTDVFPYSDMKSAAAEKYCGIQPMITLTMKDGTMHSFTGFMDAEECANIINRQIRKLYGGAPISTDELMADDPEFSYDFPEGLFGPPDDRSVSVDTFQRAITQEPGQKVLVCGKCGTILNTDDLFCPECGAIETMEQEM